MKVKLNPAKVASGDAKRPFVVSNPRTGKPFPGGEFTLSNEDLADPRVLALLPSVRAGGSAGGRFGDLVPVVSKKDEKKG
ncbi:hypothetical protein [Kiloniella laminariae]|uniref:hypothetical protein n=1 Tax=Kiloniella laminariae TaxID=454162 RepID=UPI0003788621|nr:hypothetical protein [Kiloniella laminariae]